MGPDYRDREIIWTIETKLFYILYALTDKKTPDGCSYYLNQPD